MRRLLTIAAVIVIGVIVTASSANAESGIACSMYADLVSRSLFGNTGTYATDSWASRAVLDCLHTPSGFYGNLFGSIPLAGDMENGLEADPRVGIRFKLGPLDADGSLSYYIFGVGKGEYWQTFDARLRLGHTFELADDVKLEVYGLADYQHSLTWGTDSLGLSAGAIISTTLPFAGEPSVGLGVEIWKYPLTPAPNSGPLGGPTLKIGWTVNKKTGTVVGIQGQVSIGGVDQPHSVPVRYSAGFFVSTDF